LPVGSTATPVGLLSVSAGVTLEENSFSSVRTPVVGSIRNELTDPIPWLALKAQLPVGSTAIVSGLPATAPGSTATVAGSSAVRLPVEESTEYSEIEF
jgi:hypothetical protein